ncbi:hypothetical protein Tco_1038298 [Tanacetum coccineum]
MSQRGKRGKTKGKKTYPPESFYIDFNKDGLAIGPTRYRFATWFSLELKSRISYNLEWDKVPEAMKDQLWLSAKEKSAIAKASANQNKDPARVGRSGYIGKEAQWEEDMAELIKEYPDLEGLQCVRSVKHVLGRLVPNKETGKKELTEAHRLRLKQLARKEHEMIADGTIHIAGQDPLTRVMGPDHPGRTRAKSSVVGKKKGLGNAGERKRKVVIDDYDAFVNKVTLNVLAAIPTLQQESRTSQQPQSICASGVPFDEINEIEVTLYM